MLNTRFSQQGRFPKSGVSAILLALLSQTNHRMEKTVISNKFMKSRLLFFFKKCLKTV